VTFCARQFLFLRKQVDAGGSRLTYVCVWGGGGLEKGEMGEARAEE
jgi:hypothetical protein